jgi:hypothetical protein
MATVVSTYTNDAGQVVNVYESGAEYNTVEKRLVKAPPSKAITAQNSSEFKRLRQEKQARLLRAAIVAETMDKLDVPAHGPASAVAAAGGILWREIVLSPDAYPRDRLDAWEKLGKHAGVLADPKQAPADGNTNPAVNSTLVLVLAELTQRRTEPSPDVVDGEVKDA